MIMSQSNLFTPLNHAVTAQHILLHSFVSSEHIFSARIPDMAYPQVSLDVEGYPVAPEHLKLDQVHLYVRHG